eukprot:Skav215569  [mRNA]  locus=scaffold2748:47817:48833:+ [translate_table: standard]
MDLQAYSWACGSGIRAISQEQSLKDGEEHVQQRHEASHAPGLPSLWASAVQVAEGDVDVETELGLPVPVSPDEGRTPAVHSDSDSEHGNGNSGLFLQDTGKENFIENNMDTKSLEKKTDDDYSSLIPVAEVAKDLPHGNDKDAGFLALLHAWSDDAPAAKLLEEARLESTKPAIKQSKLPQSRMEKVSNRSKHNLEALRSKFPQTRASSPPPESKRWRAKDFDIYFGGGPSTDGAIKPRVEPWPTVDEDLAREMQSTSRASPLLADPWHSKSDSLSWLILPFNRLIMVDYG